MTCIKGAEESEPAHMCLDKWTVMMKTISDSFKQADHFPGVCCSFHMMKECLVAAVIDACKQSTGQETAAYIEKTIMAAFADFLDLACGRQKTIDECKRTFADGTSKLLNSVVNPVSAQNGSALFHALKIIIRHD